MGQGGLGVGRVGAEWARMDKDEIKWVRIGERGLGWDRVG